MQRRELRIAAMAAATAIVVQSNGRTEGPWQDQARKTEEDLERLPAVTVSPGSPGSGSSPVRIQLPGGATGWAVHLEGGRPIATPAVSEGKLYVGGGFGSHDLYAID